MNIRGDCWSNLSVNNNKRRKQKTEHRKIGSWMWTDSGSSLNFAHAPMRTLPALIWFVCEFCVGRGGGNCLASRWMFTHQALLAEHSLFFVFHVNNKITSNSFLSPIQFTSIIIHRVTADGRRKNPNPSLFCQEDQQPLVTFLRIIIRGWFEFQIRDLEGTTKKKDSQSELMDPFVEFKSFHNFWCLRTVLNSHLWVPSWSAPGPFIGPNEIPEQSRDEMRSTRSSFLNSKGIKIHVKYENNPVGAQLSGGLSSPHALLNENSHGRGRGHGKRRRKSEMDEPEPSNSGRDLIN